MNDVRFAFRKLRESPAFTLIAAVTLALGIGLNTAIFSLINDLFFGRLPFKDPELVVRMYSNARERNLLELPISAPRFQHYRDGQTIFDGFAGENVFAFTLTGLGDPAQIFGGRVTSNYFDVLGVRPIRGRNFLPAEEEGADVAMVTESFWQKRMGGDPNVLGRSITLNGVAHTIVGILPNLPFSWVGPNAEVWTTRPYVIPWIHLRTGDARKRHFARGGSLETGNDRGAGAGGAALARAKLSSRAPGQDRQLVGDDIKNAA